MSGVQGSERGEVRVNDSHAVNQREAANTEKLTFVTKPVATSGDSGHHCNQVSSRSSPRGPARANPILSETRLPIVNVSQAVAF